MYTVPSWDGYDNFERKLGKKYGEYLAKRLTVHFNFIFLIFYLEMFIEIQF